MIVVGYYPPLHSDVTSYFATQPGYEYMDEVDALIQSVFEQNHMLFHDFTQPQIVGGSNSELYDLVHAGEVLTLRMVMHMVRENPELFEQYTNIDELDRLLQNAQHDIYLFGDTP